jgi:tripartite-type tricarboxylate transporter receptor subunit TctC
MRILQLTLCSLMFTPWLIQAQESADAFPSRPVQIVVPFTPGGATDIEARVYAQKLTETMGKSFVVDYKPGAGGSIGTGFVAKAAPDGHTLLVISSSFTVNPAFYKNLPYDPIKDFAAVSLMSKRVTVLIAHPSFPANTIREYLAYARANPGKVNMAATGAGSIQHLAGAWLHSVTNTRVTFVQYKGTSPLNVDLVSGRVDVNASPFVNVMPLVKSGKLKILGILSDEPSPLIPGAQVAAEQGATGYSYSSWLGVIAPRATPVAIVNKLSAELGKVAKSPDVVQKFAPEGSTMVGSSPKVLQDLIAVELERWRKIVQENDIKLEE